jgi:replicative DNA helicase
MILKKANEELLISIFLQFPQFLGKHIHAITADMFSPMIRPIFTELVNTVGRDETPDLVTMTARLRYQGKLDEVGGAATLTEYCTTPVTGQNVSQAVSELRQRYELVKRVQAYKDALELSEQALNMPMHEIPAALNEAEKVIETASKIQGKPLSSKPIGELTITLLEDIEKRMQLGGALVGISTGFPFIDSKTGGMQGGRVWVIAGKPGDGKSVLMQNFLESAVALGKKVRIYPLEMTQQEQAYRLLCSQGNLDNQSVWKGMMTRAEQAALMDAVKKLGIAKCDIVDVNGASASEILADIEQSDCDVAMVDYLQLMEDDGNKKGSREEIIASISRRLKRTAVKCGKVILTASQLNDFGQLRESRAIGQDADHVIYIEKVDDDDTKRLLKCIKNRTGERFWEKQLDFLGQFYKFREQSEY